MCWQCDNPDKTAADYLEMVEGIIATHGWFVQGVEKDRHRPSFHYTVGLTEIGLPELLVTGMRHPAAAAFLNGVAHHQFHHGGAELLAGERNRWRDDPAMTETVDVAEPTVHLVTACELYGADVRAVQLVYVDDRGRWPWEVGFRGKQSVLGPRMINARAR